MEPDDAGPPLSHLSEPGGGTPRRSRAIRIAALVLGAAIMAALAVVGLTQVDLDSARMALTGADGELLAASVALYAVGQTISGGMWSVCQGAGGVRPIPLTTSLGMHWAARAACELLPASLGEAARVALVSRHPAGQRAGAWRIAGGLAGYKAIDAAVTGAAVLTMAMIVPLPGPAGGLRWTALGAVVAVGAAALGWRLGAARHLQRLVPRRGRQAAHRLAEGAAVLSSPGAARTAAVLGVLAVVARVLSLAALLAALGAPPQAAALAFCVIVLAGIVPAAPGGAGTRELVLIPALTMAYGLPADQALAFSVAVQGTALAVSLTGGALAIAWLASGPLLRQAPDPVLETPSTAPEGTLP